MVPTRKLIAARDRAEIAHARGLTMTQRMSAGPELFDYICAAARGGIRLQFPDFTEAQVTDELHRRLDVVRLRSEPKRP